VEERSEAPHVRPASGRAGGSRWRCAFISRCADSGPAWLARSSSYVRRSTHERTRRGGLRLRRPSVTTPFRTVGQPAASNSQRTTGGTRSLRRVSKAMIITVWSDGSFGAPSG
jgi:hypothetical protein